MSPCKINIAIIAEIDKALIRLRQEEVRPQHNIDDICAIINSQNLSGDLWEIIHAYPATDEEGIVLILTMIEGDEHIVEVKLDKLTK